jgi:hypothetical protein
MIGGADAFTMSSVKHMDAKRSSVERAFELPRSGRATGLRYIQGALKREGYQDPRLEGHALRRQLREAMRAARLARRSMS